MQDKDLMVDQMLKLEEESISIIDLTDGPVYSQPVVGSPQDETSGSALDEQLIGGYTAQEAGRQIRWRLFWLDLVNIVSNLILPLAVVGMITGVAWVLLPKLDAIKWDAQRKQLAAAYFYKLSDYKINNKSAAPKGDEWLNYSQNYVLKGDTQFAVDPATNQPYQIKLNTNASANDILALAYNFVFIDEGQKCDGNKIVKGDTNNFTVRLRRQDGTILCADDEGVSDGIL